MANGVIIPSIKIMQGTFSGTTDGTGNLLLANERRLIVGVLFDAVALTGYGFLYPYTGGVTQTYLRVLSNANELKTNTAVSGTYWYITQ